MIDFVLTVNLHETHTENDVGQLVKRRCDCFRQQLLIASLFQGDGTTTRSVYFRAVTMSDNSTLTSALTFGVTLSPGDSSLSSASGASAVYCGLFHAVSRFL